MNTNKEALERWLVVATIAGPTSLIASSVYNDVVYRSIVDLGKAHVDKINNVINVTPSEGTLVWKQLRTMPSFEEYITVDALELSQLTFSYQHSLMELVIVISCITRIVVGIIITAIAASVVYKGRITSVKV